MDPEASHHDNAYAPPAGEAQPDRREPWTVGSAIAASLRTSLRFPVLAWVGLGAIPTLGNALGFLESTDAMPGLAILGAMFVVSAVLAGGCFKLALELTRGLKVSLGVYFRYANLAPGYLVLSLPLFVPVALSYLIGEPEDPNSVDALMILMFVLAVFVGLYLLYRLSLAHYALVDSNPRLRLAVTHSWRRIGTNSAQFFALFVVTSIPLAVSFGLAATVPVASALFDVAISPLITLCWAHAYVAGRAAAVN